MAEKLLCLEILMLEAALDFSAVAAPLKVVDRSADHTAHTHNGR
jgi:hypothetical protein